MADFSCKRCGLPIHLGSCQGASDAEKYRVDSLPTGEAVVKLNGVTVATGFDSRAEAQEWIDAK